MHLPDDIEQRLLDGQYERATHDLMERRKITVAQARALAGQWLYEQQKEAKLYGRRRDNPPK